jgi:cytochrome c oxidase accessory protein FixG
MNYSTRRYFVYLIITIFTLVLPFIKINGNHILLLSFTDMEFHFIGMVFNMDELYVMPFLIMFLFISIFATTAIYGRVWCGWACPQTIFRVIYRDLIESKIMGLKSIKNKQKDTNYSKIENSIKKIIAISIWSILATIASINFMLYFVPSQDYFSYLLNPSEHYVVFGFTISLVLFLIANVVFVKEKFCSYLCPYSRVQLVLYDNDTKQVIYDKNRGDSECTHCDACVRVCPTNIDIKEGLQLECINCLECSDACEKVMKKLDSESLISWSTTNNLSKKRVTKLLSKRNMMYFGALIITVLLAIVSANKQDSILVNINRTTSLYNVEKNGNISNNYILTIHNTQNREYTYDISLNNSNYTINRFSPTKIGAKKMTKKVLVIESKNNNTFDMKESSINIKIDIFAKENHNIKISKEVVFLYP